MLQTTKEQAWTPPKRGEWTYKDYLQLPDDGKRYEIIRGVLYVANAPSMDHQYTVTALAARLYNYVETHQLGRVYVAPCEVHLSDQSKPVQPDVFFIQQSRLPERRATFFEGPPDLVVEVISPSSIRLDRVTKFTEYEQTRVTEYWIVDPRARMVEVYVLARGEYALLGTFREEDVIESQLLKDIAIVAQTLFT